MRLILLSALLSLLGACASVPSTIILGPQVRPGDCCANTSVMLQVVDNRPGPQLAQLVEEGEPPLPIPPANNVEDAIRKALMNGLKQRGVNLGGAGAAPLRVEITQLLASVRSGLVKHQTDVAITLSFHFSSGNRELTRTFNGNRSDTKPVRPDVAAIEKQINLLLGDVLTNALNDAELMNAIRQSEQ